MFQSLTRDSNHSNWLASLSIRRSAKRFQSLTRDSNHSNRPSSSSQMRILGFNPSRGIAIIQTVLPCLLATREDCFNPSRGIAIIQTLVSLEDDENG